MSLRKTQPELYNAVMHMLQGLAYWMGYKAECYHDHILMEYSCVDEAVSILKANINNMAFVVKQEVAYNTISPGLSGNDRADIAIFDKKNQSKCYCVIEFKKATRSMTAAEDDIKKLAKINPVIPRLEVVLIPGVLCTSVCKELLQSNGFAKKKSLVVPETNIGYHVIRSVRALSSHNPKKPFQVICLEVD